MSSESDRVVVKAGAFRGFEAVLMRSTALNLAVLPSLGGKIASLRSEATGTEFVWQDPTRPYRTAVFGPDFGEYDASGIDECFPSVNACRYPEEPWRGVEAVDHGELWSRPWRWKQAEGGIDLGIDGVRFPYHFEKRIRLHDTSPCVRFEYRLTSRASSVFKYIWLAHPLLAAREGMRIVIPGSPKVLVSFALNQRVHVDFPREHDWPYVESPAGELIDYSLIGSPEVHENDKVFVRAPAEGWCALWHPDWQEHLRIEFSPEQHPWLGICINHCGWPLTGTPAYWVAIEPSNSCLDAVDKAIEGDQAGILEPNQSTVWSWSMGVNEGMPDGSSA